MNVLSLCDGMSCGQIVLKELNIKVDNYYSMEIKKSGMYVTQLNFPNTIQLGNVNNFDISMINGNKIDLFLCGSPCKNMSLINGTSRNGINGEKSKLFFKCVEIMNEIKPKYFLFENVGSMTNKDKDTMSKYLGCKPININSSLVSAQIRNRYYWTNLPNVTIPKDRNILLKDIIEYNSKSEENWSDKKRAFVERKKDTMYVNVDGDKSIPLTARGYQGWNTQYVTDVDGIRDLTINEYRKLQTIPEWYNFGDLIKSKITDLLGDGWNIETIKHILSFLPKEYKENK